MANPNDTKPSRLELALDALGNLMLRRLRDAFTDGQSAGLAAHSEIQLRPVSEKSGAFYRHLVPLHSHLVGILAESYRGYFKIALANPHESDHKPEQWALSLLQPFVVEIIDWIRDWYMLACDGENQYLRPVASTAFAPGKTVTLDIPLAIPPSPPLEAWRAPAWLFSVSPLVGITRMKSEHVPATDNENRLSGAHTRLLLKGARRVFLSALGAAIENVRNEETAAAGAIPENPLNAQTKRHIKRKGWQQKQKLYVAIQKILHNNPSLQGMEFCAELDKRHAPPLLDWTESGEWSTRGMTWKEAWANPSLRRKIRRVRQEAQKFQ